MKEYFTVVPILGSNTFTFKFSSMERVAPIDSKVPLKKRRFTRENVRESAVPPKKRRFIRESVEAVNSTVIVLVHLGLLAILSPLHVPAWSLTF